MCQGKKISKKRKQEQEIGDTVIPNVKQSPALAPLSVEMKKKEDNLEVEPSNEEMQSEISGSVPAAVEKKRKKKVKSDQATGGKNEAAAQSQEEKPASKKLKKVVKRKKGEGKEDKPDEDSAEEPTVAKGKKGQVKRKQAEQEGEGTTVPAKRARKSLDEGKAQDQKDKKKEAKAESTSATTLEGLPADEYLKKHAIKIMNGENVEPYQKFEDLKMSAVLLQQFTKAGFGAPSPIQGACWPVAFAGQDLIAIAKTGSGKTLGFLVPAFSRILKKMPQDTRLLRVQPGAPPMAMVVAPTRELTLQIHEESSKFGNPLRVVSVAVHGGVPSGKQIRQLRCGCHIVVATPGRLQDLLDLDNPPVTNLNNVEYAVLDEADQMLDMGFEPAITKLMGLLPEEHQTLMFTATWPVAIQKIARKFLKSPTHIQVGGDGLRANADVTQEFIAIGHGKGKAATREAALIKALSNECRGAGSAKSILVFCNRKSECDSVAKIVKRCGLSVTPIHGDLDQSERLSALRLFKQEKIQVIVATDVAARGLDIDGVGLVVNYEFPPSGCESWVHRVGRTGRAGRQGLAVTLFDPNGTERRHAPELLSLLRRSQKGGQKSGDEDEGKPDKNIIPPWLPSLATTVAPQIARLQSKKDYYKTGKGGKGGKGGGGWKGSGKGGKSNWGSRW